MLCSSNISDMEVMRLSSMFGVPLTKKSGMYLGHHVLHRGRNGDAHRALVEHVQSRLEGWKLKCLSRARRLTLAQSVLNSMPLFQMQLQKLSDWVSNELEKSARKCIWGGRGIYLLNWDTLTSSKEAGGANIKTVKEMNWALLAKLVRRLLVEEDNMWA